MSQIPGCHQEEFKIEFEILKYDNYLITYFKSKLCLSSGEIYVHISLIYIYINILIPIVLAQLPKKN